ncbi:hypothetical protein IWW46_003430 [Coemansia sp. RSA 2440]|nr:hypothetical protein IWW46_003430 [Coemansia sp. RSA 2440]
MPVQNFFIEQEQRGICDTVNCSTSVLIQCLDTGRSAPAVRLELFRALARSRSSSHLSTAPSLQPTVQSLRSPF